MTHSPLHPMPRQMPCQAAPSHSHCSRAAAPASSLAFEERRPKEDALFQPASPRSQAPGPCLGPHRVDGAPATDISVATAPLRHPTHSNGQPKPSPLGPLGPRSSSPGPSSSHTPARPQPRHRIRAPERHHALRLHRSHPAAMDKPRLKQRSPCRG
jgi:hypothetical protein